MDRTDESSQPPPQEEGPYMMWASHFIIREELRGHCDALETRQDEQFGETCAEFKRMNTRFDGLERWMNAMHHNFTHQNEALQRSMAEIARNTRPRSCASSSSRHHSSGSSSARHRSPRQQDHNASAPRRNEDPVDDHESSSQHVPSTRWWFFIMASIMTWRTSSSKKSTHHPRGHATRWISSATST